MVDKNRNFVKFISLSLKILVQMLMWQFAKLNLCSVNKDSHYWLTSCQKYTNIMWTVTFFKKKFWRTWVLFVGPLIPLFWTSGDISFCVCVTLHVPWDSPTSILVASMAAEQSLPHTCKALVGFKTGSYHAAAHSMRSGRPDALPTELSRLGYADLTLPELYTVKINMILHTDFMMFMDF